MKPLLEYFKRSADEDKSDNDLLEYLNRSSQKPLDYPESVSKYCDSNGQPVGVLIENHPETFVLLAKDLGMLRYDEARIRCRKLRTQIPALRNTVTTLPTLDDWKLIFKYRAEINQYLEEMGGSLLYGDSNDIYNECWMTLKYGRNVFNTYDGTLDTQNRDNYVNTRAIAIL